MKPPRGKYNHLMNELGIRNSEFQARGTDTSLAATCPCPRQCLNIPSCGRGTVVIRCGMSGMTNSKFEIEEFEYSSGPPPARQLQSSVFVVRRGPREPEILRLRQVVEGGEKLLVVVQRRAVACLETKSRVEDLDTNPELDVEHVLL